jgi:hypothetical protein
MPHTKSCTSVLYGIEIVHCPQTAPSHHGCYSQFSSPANMARAGVFSADLSLESPCLVPRIHAPHSPLHSPLITSGTLTNQLYIHPERSPLTILLPHGEILYPSTALSSCFNSMCFPRTTVRSHSCSVIPGTLQPNGCLISLPLSPLCTCHIVRGEWWAPPPPLSKCD